jgi:thioredoxin-like negative regulator of GroEL
MSASSIRFPRNRSKARSGPKPQLVYFYSARSGPSRRVEGYLAQVLQRRANHDAFLLHRVDVDEQPAIASRFGIRTLPTLVVIDNKHVEARLEAPSSCGEIQAALARWLE